MHGSLCFNVNNYSNPSAKPENMGGYIVNYKSQTIMHLFSWLVLVCLLNIKDSFHCKPGTLSVNIQGSVYRKHTFCGIWNSIWKIISTCYYKYKGEVKNIITILPASVVYVSDHTCIQIILPQGKTLISSPDPTLLRGETVWWTKSNFLG